MDVFFISSNVNQYLTIVLLGVRKKQAADDSVASEDVLKMFKDYVGAVEVDTSEQDKLKENIQTEK